MSLRRSLWLVVALVALWQPTPPQAQSRTLLNRSLFTLNTLSPVFDTGKLALSATTDSITVRMRRPTTGNPLAWDSSATVRVSVIESVDGTEYVSTSQFTGGIRLTQKDTEAPEAVKRLNPQLMADTVRKPEFQNGGKTFITLTRLGETAATEYAVRVRIELIRGSSATIDLLAAEETTAPPPTVETHHSVAFDSVIDAQDTTGDGVLSVTIDPVGTTNLAAFAGSGNSDAGAGRLGSTTYNAVAMTEEWDATFATDFGHAGYSKASIPATSVTVTNTLAGTTSEHGFGVVIMTGVNQSDPTGTATFTNGTGTSDFRYVAANIDDFIIDNLYSNNTTPTIGGGQDLRYTENIAAATGIRGSSRSATGGATMMSWTALGNPWGHGAIAFVPASSVALTGTVTASITESDIVTGGKTIILTATDDFWVKNTATITYVGGQDAGFAGTTSNTDITFALTNGLASTPAADDLVVVTFCTGSTVDRTLSITNTAGTAYTTIGAELFSDDTFDVNMLVAYRFMPGTPETAVRFAGGTGNAADAGTYTIQVFRNVNSTTTMDVAAVTQSQANSNTRLVNPPSITPTTEGAWVGVSGCGAGGTLTADYTDPRDLNDWRTDGESDTNDSGVGSGYFRWTSGAHNEAAYTGGGTDTTSDSWASVVWALRPATTTTFDDIRDELRDGCDSAQAEGAGWDARRATILPVGNVVRTSSTVVTMTGAADGSYDITAQETVTCTVPAVSLRGNTEVVASPTFTIDAGGGAPATGHQRLSYIGVGD